MKQEDKVCTLEQAKKLVELDIVLKTEYHWTENTHKEWYLNKVYNGCHKEFPAFYPAPDVAELGVLLKGYKVWINSVGYWQLTKGNHLKELKTFNYKFTEAQARCEALIWLIENDYIKPENLKL